MVPTEVELCVLTRLLGIMFCPLTKLRSVFK